METKNGGGTTLVLGGEGETGNRVSAAAGVWYVGGLEPAWLPG